MELGGDIETGDLQVEMEALEETKKLVLERRQRNRPVGYASDAQRALSMEKTVTESESHTHQGEYSVDRSFDIRTRTVEDEVSSRHDTQCEELTESSFLGEPGGALVDATMFSRDGPARCQTPTSKHDHGNSLSRSSMTKSVISEAKAHDFEHGRLTRDLENTSRASSNFSTSAVAGSPTTSDIILEPMDRGFSEAGSDIFASPNLTRLISGMADLKLRSPASSQSASSHEDARSSQTGGVRRKITAEISVTTAVNNSVEVQPPPSHEYEGTQDGSGSSTLKPIQNSAETHTHACESASEAGAADALPRDQPQSKLPETSPKPSRTPEASAAPRRFSPSPDVAPTVSASTPHLNPFVRPKPFSSRVHSSGATGFHAGSKSTVFAPQYQWTKKRTGDEVNDPCEALEIFCQHSGLKPPAYNTTYMPLEGVFFCIVFVGNTSFKSYPTLSLSEKRAKEVAAEQAVEKLGITSSVLETLVAKMQRSPH